MTFLIYRDGFWLGNFGKWVSEEGQAKRFGSYERAKAEADKVSGAKVVQRMGLPG